MIEDMGTAKPKDKRGYKKPPPDSDALTVGTKR
jgi:hypothetical protein